MTKKEIITAAYQNNAVDFMKFLWNSRIGYEVLYQDNLFDDNDGYCNLSVAGMPEGESILFFDGEFQGL